MKTTRIHIAALIALIFATNIFAQDPPQYTRNKADQSLRSNGRVNPSTLGLEIDVPLGGYPSRGINLPLSLSYSSKQWRLQEERCGSAVNGLSQTWARPQFSENAAGGWTSSLSQPYIEYTGEWYRFQDDGEPLSTSDFLCTPETPRVGDSYIKRIMVYAGGSSHELIAQDAAVAITQGQVPDESVWNTTYYATDGSGIKYVQNSSLNSYRLYMPDGSFYDFDSTRARKSTADPVWTRKANRLTDVHGNYVQFLLPDPGNSAEVAAYPNGYWKDQLERKFPVMMPRNNPSAPVDQAFTLPGMSAPYVLKWKRLKGSSEGTSALKEYSNELAYPGSWRLHGMAPEFGPALFGAGFDYSCAGSSSAVYAISYGEDDKFNPVVLTDIVLPNGASYKFKYNVYGEIEQIEYPTGGREEIAYEVVPAVAELTSLYKDVNRGVTQRNVYESISDGASDPWSYSAAVSANNYRTSIVAPDGTQVDRYMHRGVPKTCFQGYPDPIYTGVKWGYDNVLAGREYEQRSFDSDGHIVSRQVTRWTATNTNVPLRVAYNQKVKRNARVETTENITYDGASGVSAATKLDYANEDALGSPLNITKTSEYAFKTVSDGNTFSRAQTDTVPPTDAPTLSDPTTGATLLRVTETAYKTDQPYLDRNFVKLPIEVTIKDAGGNPNSKSQIVYDDPTYLVADSPSGTVPGWSSPGTTVPRGLPTIARAWYDIAANQYVETRTQYNQFGSIRKTWDGNGNVSQIEYTDNYSDGIDRNTFAFPTKSISPVPGGNGSTTAFTSTVKYDFNSRLPVSSMDPNGVETRMEYIDPLLRPTRVAAYSGGQQVGAATETIYGAGTDTLTRFVKTRSQIDGTNWKEGYVWFDGLGRTTRSQSVDSNGDVFVETEYDAMSRPYKVTNPYRNGETIYKTESVFDTAGRPWKTITPDGAVVETSYSVATTGPNIGTAVTVKDQSLKIRRSITNALGHLTRVDEPNAAGQLGAIDNPNQPTFYTYDLLNNLTQVQQPGDNNEECGSSTTLCSQTRSFQYDALSRLKQAANPESGTILYTYDSNSNLQTKTDARQVVTTFAYDALNRVKTRTYSAPGGLQNYQATPEVSYYYDNLANAKGKLIKVTNGTGPNLSTTEYASFDILGRVTRSKQTTDGVVYGDDANPMTYSYNLSGALIEQLYPSGRVVKNVLDSDGELATVQSKKNTNHAFWNYANHFTYNAAGAVTSMQLGNGRWESTQFNSRLQPTQIALGSVQNGTDKLKLNYEYGELFPGQGNTDFTKNNGNVSKQTITVGSVGATPGFVATQYYSYDSLNRIQIATENVTPTGGSEEPSWRQSFSYDRHGNRNFVTTGATATTTLRTCPTEVCNPSISPNTNKITSTGYSFDAAGNTARDAQDRKFTYDAENKQTKVESLIAGTQTVTGTIGEYFYDGDGRRVKKRAYEDGVLTEETIFVYDAAGKLIGEYSNEVGASEVAKVAYLTTDHLGSPRINTDINGNVISRHDYHPFGEEVGTSKRVAGLGYVDDSVRKQFTGYERDEETSLDFAQARYFGSSLGRFSSPDYFANDTSQAAPQSWNLYSYTRNNPIKFVDRTGKSIIIAVNGVEYRAVRSKDTGQYRLSGNDGSNKTVQESEKLLNIVAQKFRAEVDNLDEGRQASIFNINDGNANGTRAAHNGVYGVATTRSSVNITTAVEAESGASLATEILVANYLVQNPSGMVQTSQGTVDGVEGAMVVEDPENGPPRMAAFDRTVNNLAYRARAAFGLSGEYLRINPFDQPLLVPIAPPPAGSPADPTGTQGADPGPPDSRLGPKPPPPPCNAQGLPPGCKETK